MNKRMGRIAGVLAVTVVVGLAGCGGGGGQSGSSLGGSRATIPVFVTDSPETENDHVWATIFKVEVQNQNGQIGTVFDDSAGRAIDLKSLHDLTGQRFAFLSNAALSSGTHTQVRVTLGPSLTLFPRGSSSGQQVPLEDNVARDSQGHAVVSFPLGTPRNLASGSDDLVIDFDLAHFTQQNGKISPALREGEHAGLNDPARHEREDHLGTVADLSGTAPNFSFTLQGAGGGVTVVTDASTVFFNSDAATNPTLANGESVEVTGSFDVSTKRLTAKRIKIEDRAQHGPEAEVEGAPSAIQPTAGTFAVTAQKVRGLVPTQASVNVVTNASTVFRSSGGIQLSAAEFFAALATSAKVEVEGAFDANSNTLTASRARLEDEKEDAGQHEAEARGAAINVQAGGGHIHTAAGDRVRRLCPYGQ